METTPKDPQKHVSQIIDLFYKMENMWNSDGPPLHLLENLKNLITACKEWNDPVLKKLSEYAQHLTFKMTPEHFTGVLVPFERYLDRALRDDEFLVKEHDQLNKKIHRVPVVVILDNLRSAFNVGSIFRTAECFALEKVYLTGYTPTPHSPKTAKTAMGTEKLVPWEHIKNIEPLIANLKQNRYHILALETSQKSIPLFSYQFDGPTAFIVGNERFGLDRKILGLCDGILEVPLYGQKNSLNVGVAFSIVSYQWRQQFEYINSKLNSHNSSSENP